MTHAEQILAALRRVIGANTAAEFSRDDIRREAGVSQKVWSASFGPIFQGMRVDQPGGAPSVGAAYQKVFRRLRHGIYAVTEYGSQLANTPAFTNSVLPTGSTPSLVHLAPAPATNDESFAEGRELFRLHRHQERSRSLVRRKKRRVLSDRGKLACEVCEFDFAAAYGPLGDEFAECHHTRPLAELRVERRTRLSELAVVCANCHRMLHRRPLHSVAQLRVVVLARRADQDA